MYQFPILRGGRATVSVVDLTLISKAVIQPLDYFVPSINRLLRTKGELNIKEKRLIDSFQDLDNNDLENTVVDLVQGPGIFAQKGEARKTHDDLKWYVDASRGKKYIQNPFLSAHGNTNISIDVPRVRILKVEKSGND